MFNLSGSEIIFLLLIALIVLGPDKLPEAVRKFGKVYGEIKKMGTGFQTELKSALDEPMREMRETAEAFKKAANFDFDTADEVVEPSVVDPSVVEPAVSEGAVAHPDFMAPDVVDRSRPVPADVPDEPAVRPTGPNFASAAPQVRAPVEPVEVVEPVEPVEETASE
jgi:sec-independent protein translocase protein TatB